MFPVDCIPIKRSLSMDDLANTKIDHFLRITETRSPGLQVGDQFVAVLDGSVWTRLRSVDDLRPLIEAGVDRWFGIYVSKVECCKSLLNATDFLTFPENLRAIEQYKTYVSMMMDRVCQIEDSLIENMLDGLVLDETASVPVEPTDNDSSSTIPPGLLSIFAQHNVHPGIKTGNVVTHKIPLKLEEFKGYVKMMRNNGVSEQDIRAMTYRVYHQRQPSIPLIEVNPYIYHDLYMTAHGHHRVLRTLGQFNKKFAY